MLKELRCPNVDLFQRNLLWKVRRVITKPVQLHASHSRDKRPIKHNVIDQNEVEERAGNTRFTPRQVARAYGNMVAVH